MNNQEILTRIKDLKIRIKITIDYIASSQTPLVMMTASTMSNTGLN
ncbi:hypothetical protein M0R04_12465 [Candidatus Dojkabacteria bacterium]|nr:hypothetical protein [Candidatus Dojkabacteria bacterium]